VAEGLDGSIIAARRAEGIAEPDSLAAELLAELRVT
jgi:hypothetical protein